MKLVEDNDRIWSWLAWLVRLAIVGVVAIIVVVVLFIRSAKAQVPFGDTIIIPTTLTLIDTTSYYRVYYSNWSVKQNEVLWKDVRVPKGGAYEELDFRSGNHFESKGFTVNVTRDSLGNMDIIEYWGLNRKPIPAPYQPLQMYIPKKWEIKKP